MADPRTLRTHPELRSMHSFPMFKTLGEKPKNALEKLLSLFADVRAGEGGTVLLMITNVFLLLGAYYLLKVVRDTIILSDYSAKVKAYSSSGQALALLIAVPIYGWVGTKVNRIKLVTGLTAFFMSHLVIFAVLYSLHVQVDIVFYIWVGIFNFFVISQFWAFANDVFSEGQGRRLFPIIGVGASVGAFLGSGSATQFFKSNLAPSSSMFVALVILSATIVLMILTNRREKTVADPATSKEAEEPLGDEGAFALILRDRYLFWIAVLTIILNLVNTTGGYLMDRMIESRAAEIATADRGRFIGTFYGTTYTWVNGIGLLMQAFGVSRIFRYAGVRGAMFFLPLLDLAGYAALAVAPLLGIARAVKIMENATDYSIQNTVRQAFFLPTSREAKYKAKAAVDTFCARFGDMGQSAVVFIGDRLGLAVSGIAWILVGFVIVWLWVAGQIATEHRRRTV